MDNRGQVRQMTKKGRLQSVSEGPLVKAGRLELTVFEAKRRERAVLQRLEFLTSVLENLPYPFYVIDASDYVICLTNAARAYRGESTEKITCHGLLHQSDKPCASAEYPCPIETIKETKRPFKVEHVHDDRESGMSRVVEIHAFPILDRGIVSHIVEYWVDITKRRETEDALKQSQEKLSELTNELLETNKAIAIMARNLDRGREQVEKTVAGAISYKIVPIIEKLQDDPRLKGSRVAGRNRSQDLMANERRRFVRFQVKSPTYAALGHYLDRVGKVKDISIGGLAFEYISDQDSMEATTLVYIFLVDENVHLSDVPCTVAYEHDVKKHDTLRRFGRPLVTKRCGVRFGALAENQREQLENLITRHTFGPLP